MYKIYINETPLLLLKEEALLTLPKATGDRMIVRYLGKPKFLFNYIDLLEKTDRFESIVIYSDQYDQLKTDFEGHFKIIEAAGGVVYNQRDEILFIYRRDSWDLPKGKVDEGESSEEAAVREVREETGLSQLELGAPLPDTYHTYRTKSGKRILKRTYWYLMKTAEEALVPQTEEDIEIAEWMSLSDFFKEDRVVYSSIRELLETELV